LGIQVIGYLAVPGETPVELGVQSSARSIDIARSSMRTSSTSGRLPGTPRRCAISISYAHAADEGKTVRVPIDPIGLPLPNSREEDFDGSSSARSCSTRTTS